MRKRNLLLGVAGLGVYWASRQRTAIRTMTEIDASREAVWAVLTDTDAYPEWNSLLTEFKGNLRVGERLSFVLRTSAGLTLPIRPTVVKADAGDELRWEGDLPIPGLVNANHAFLLSTTYGGKTVLHHTEDYQGALVPFLAPLLKGSLETDFHQLDQAIKRRAEATQSRSQPDGNGLPSKEQT